MNKTMKAVIERLSNVSFHVHTSPSVFRPILRAGEVGG